MGNSIKECSNDSLFNTCLQVNINILIEKYRREKRKSIMKLKIFLISQTTPLNSIQKLRKY